MPTEDARAALPVEVCLRGLDYWSAHAANVAVRVDCAEAARLIRILAQGEAQPPTKPTDGEVEVATRAFISNYGWGHPTTSGWRDGVREALKAAAAHRTQEGQTND